MKKTVQPIDPEIAVQGERGDHSFLSTLALLILAAGVVCLLIFTRSGRIDLMRRLIWHRFCKWCSSDIERPFIPFRRFWKRTDGICPECFERVTGRKPISTEPKKPGCSSGIPSRTHTAWLRWLRGIFSTQTTKQP